VDFANGTVTLRDKCIKVHHRHRTGICRRVMVASDCVIPAKHEANIPVYLEDDGVPIPPCDWAIEPQGLDPSVMTARTLFSDTQKMLVARVLNNSVSDKSLSVNLFLSVAEPVQCLPGTDHCHTSGLVFAEPSGLCEQKDRAEQFIRSHAHVFSRSEYDIGRTSIIPHRIDTGDNSPHFEQLRRHPTAQLPVIDEHVSHMLEHDVIEPAASPWCSNVIMVRKQDGTMRLCVDYRKLNCLTVKDKFPLPKIDTCLDTLNGCEFFSTCDLRCGYWQTEINERDRDKTAFVTRKG